MEQEGKSTSEPNQEVREIFSEFLAGVVKFEQLAEIGRRLLVSFQQALIFLRRPSIHETSELVQSILKQNETKRVKSYVEAGCINANDSSHTVTQMSTSLCGLHDHLTKAQLTLVELAVLMDKAGSSLQDRPGWPSDISELNFVEVLEQNLIPESNVRSLDACCSASFMAVIYIMVKQDYLMQERVISSLGFKSTSEELDSYNLMWSLRPCVSDNIIHDAINYKL
ncbi:uncharacterized protein LOC141592340 [Silene latifolia]|uniref:uncharacterized protein LOC141592340 n=1 Tax=Silene latifolia TaxID=37657 RepID=UPI003D770E9B